MCGACCRRPEARAPGHAAERPTQTQAALTNTVFLRSAGVPVRQHNTNSLIQAVNRPSLYSWVCATASRDQFDSMNTKRRSRQVRCSCWRRLQARLCRRCYRLHR